MSGRPFLDIDMDNFDKRMTAIEPGLSMKCRTSWVAASERLANLLKYMDGKGAAEDTLKKLLAAWQLMAAVQRKLGVKPSEGGSTDA